MRQQCLLVAVPEGRGVKLAGLGVENMLGKFDPQSVTEEYAKLCRQYRIRSVIGDNFARDWVAGAWRKLGFEYIRSSRPKGAIYLESLPVFTRGLARLPNNARLIRELRLLERRTHRSGKDTVEHPRNGHDDHANVVCGVLSLLAPPASEQPTALLSPIMARGAPIPPRGGGGREIIEWKKKKTVKRKNPQPAQPRL